MDYSFFDSSYDGVVVLDAERGIVYCNNAAALIFDSSVRRLSKGKKLQDVISLGDPQLFFNAGTLGLESPCPWTEMNYELVGKEKGGKIQVSIQPFKNDQGSFWVLNLHDVTLEETLHRKYQGELEQKEDVILQLQKARTQLEAYSKDLEKMVAARTQELSSANQMLNGMMDSLGQGFLVFDQDGTCSNTFTKACLTVLEGSPAAKPAWEVLKLKADEQDQFKMWLKASYSESLPFDSLKTLAPQNYAHSEGKHITLDYFPIRNAEGAFTNMVLVATDKTAEYEANLALEKEKKYAEMILKLVTSRDQFSKFIESTEEIIAKTQGLVAQKKLDKDQVFRLLHTLEGEAGAFSAEPIRLASRVSQQLLQGLQAVPGTQEIHQLQESLTALETCYHTFLEDNSKLFAAINLKGGRNYEFTELELQNFLETLEHSKVSRDLIQEFEKNFLRLPLVNMLRHYDAVVSNVSAHLGKKIHPLIFDCGDVRVSARQLEPLFSSLVHAFRNAVDHGIESPEDREMLSKEPYGTIKITAHYMENPSWARIEIQDDGGGINVEAISKRAKQKISGLDVDSLTETQVLQLVFHPGFSTREGVGEFSGRGIGMDAIRYEVAELGGKVWMESTFGQGSKLCLEIPVSEIKPQIAKSA